MGKRKKMVVDGTVITGPDGSKVDTWPLRSIVPQFNWDIFLQELADVLKPVQLADTSQIRSAISKLQTVSVATQELVNSVQSQIG